MRMPFVIYADFECFTESIETCQPNDKESFTQQYQKHTSSGYCYMIKCYDDNLYKPSIHRYTKKSADDVRKFKSPQNSHFGFASDSL